MNERKARARLIAALPGVHPWGDVVDLLLPVVREIAAEELREAAVAMVGAGSEVSRAAQWLNARADALTKPPDGPVR